MVDRFIRFLLSCCSVSCLVYTDAAAILIDTNVTKESVYLTDSLKVTHTGVLEATEITIGNSLSVINAGKIYSNFSFDDAWILYVQNSGYIDGQFNLTNGAQLVQVVHSADDVKQLNVSSKFTVLVENAKNLSLSDVFSISGGVNKIILNDSNLMLGGGYTSTVDSIEIVGNVSIVLQDISEINYETPILTKVSGDGRVLFEVPGLDPLYSIQAKVDNGNLYMVLLRETDYAKIWNNSLGSFLNNLRGIRSDDKLLAAMDMMANKEQLESVMARSVRLHPIHLMDMVRRANMLDLLGVKHFAGSNVDYELMPLADVMFSDSGILYRAGMSARLSLGKYSRVDTTGYIGMMNFSDDINEFDALLYGVQMGVHYDDGLIQGNAMIGLSGTQFNVGPVFDGLHSVSDPMGYNMYAGADIGLRVWCSDLFCIVPFVGIVADRTAILNDTDSSVLANAGLNIDFHLNDFDVLYDYGLRGGIMTDGVPYAMIFAKFTAPEDGVAGQIALSLINDDVEPCYKISVMANISF